MNKTLLDAVQQKNKQKIFEYLSQAIGEDRQEADAILGLHTHVSDPFLNWDLIYRNLINAFSESEVKYSICKRGMWEILLLYEKSSGLLLSFMRDTRFQAIKKLKVNNQPQYIRSLILLNSELQASEKQQSMFEISESEDEIHLKRILDELCAGFEEKIDDTLVKHALVVFSNQCGGLSSLKAYVLDHDLDIVCEQDWLDAVKPVMSNEVETANDRSVSHSPVLKQKSLDRLHKKELVALKEKDIEKQA